MSQSSTEKIGVHLFVSFTLSDLLRFSDIVSVNTPLNEQTKGLINEDFLNQAENKNRVRKSQETEYDEHLDLTNLQTTNVPDTTDDIVKLTREMITNNKN